MTQMGFSRPHVERFHHKAHIDQLSICIFGAGDNLAKALAGDLGLCLWWMEPSSIAAAREKGSRL